MLEDAVTSKTLRLNKPMRIICLYVDALFKIRFKLNFGLILDFNRVSELQVC